MAKTKKSEQDTLKKFAPYGLWLSAAGFVAALILGVMKLLVFMELYTPPDAKRLNLMFWISVGLVVVGPCIYALLDPQGTRNFLVGRQARYGSNALVLTAAFLGILIVANVITYQNPRLLGDLTEDKQNTLAPESLEVLKTLPEPVTAVAFYSSRTPVDTASKLLMNFQANSEGKFQYRFVDPELNPIAAQEAEITRDGVILLQMGDRQEQVTYADENEITGALIRLMNPDERSVYFLSGHGEKDIEQASDASMTSVKSTLEGKNYTVKTLNLIATNAIPEDAAAIVIAGPKKPVSKTETELLKAYLENGGSLVLLAEPAALTDFGDTQDPLGEMLNEDWGITLDNNLVLDPTVNPPYVAVAAQYGFHAITDKMGTMVSVFPEACSLTVENTPEGKTVTPLILSTDSAWGETTLTGKEGEQTQFDAGADKQGPLVLAAAGETSGGEGRLAVFGDSDFANDSTYTTYGNSDMIINTIDWAVGRDSSIGITPKEPVERSIRFMSQLGVIGILLGAVCLVPGLVLIGGLAAWAARRSRG